MQTQFLKGMEIENSQCVSFNRQSGAFPAFMFHSEMTEATYGVCLFMSVIGELLCLFLHILLCYLCSTLVSHAISSLLSPRGSAGV